MANTFTLTNTLGTALTLADLDNITINASANIEISGLFSIEKIANSTDLQTALTAGDATLTVNGTSVTDLADLCISPSEFALASALDWVWFAAKKGRVPSPVAVDYVRFDRAGNNTSPFIAPIECDMLDFTVASTQASDVAYDIHILKSTDEGTTWPVEATLSITTRYQSGELRTPIRLQPGNLVRFVKTAGGLGTLENPQINVTVREV